MKRVLEKLVRDEIPARLEAAGVAYEARTASPDELGALLFAKLQEEVNELLGATSAADALDEVADILEVLAALASRYGADEEDLRLTQRRKRDTRGGETRRCSQTVWRWQKRVRPDLQVGRSRDEQPVQPPRPRSRRRGRTGGHRRCTWLAPP